MPRSAQVRRRIISAVLIVATAVLLNTLFVRVNHLSGHPLVLDTVFTGVAAAACGPLAGAVTGILSTLAIRFGTAYPLTQAPLVAMNGLTGLIIGLILRWNQEISPGRLLLGLAAVVLASSTGSALIADNVALRGVDGGLDLIRTTYRVLDVNLPWPRFLSLLPLNLADKMLTVGAAVLVGPLLGSYRARWIAGRVTGRRS